MCKNFCMGTYQDICVFIDEDKSQKNKFKLLAFFINANYCLILPF